MNLYENKIEEAITEFWGERCEDFNPNCPCCQAWIEYDQISTMCTKRVLSTFGRCTRCLAIISLDRKIRGLCDRCMGETK